MRVIKKRIQKAEQEATIDAVAPKEMVRLSDHVRGGNPAVRSGEQKIILVQDARTVEW